MSARVKIELVFDVLEEDVLRMLAALAIKNNGMGHEFDPEDLADCTVELLLHSNPSILAYNDYGLELVRCETTNE